MSKLRLLKEDKISVKTVLSKQPKIVDIEEYKEIKEKAQKKMKKNINFNPISLPIMTFGTHENRRFFKELLSDIAI